MTGAALKWISLYLSGEGKRSSLDDGVLTENG